MIRDEGHLYFRNSFKKISKSVFKFGGCTAFAVHHNNNSYAVTAKHCAVNSHSLLHLCADVALLGNEALQNHQHYFPLDLRDGFVNAEADENFATCITKSIVTAGDQLMGMSGSPVLNGCGLVGIANIHVVEPKKIDDNNS